MTIANSVKVEKLNISSYSVMHLSMLSVIPHGGYSGAMQGDLMPTSCPRGRVLTCADSTVKTALNLLFVMWKYVRILH